MNQSKFPHSVVSSLVAAVALGYVVPAQAATTPADVRTTPRVILVSLDGATPRIVEKYLTDGVLPSDKGLGLLRAKGVRAAQNVTATPSLTAVGHVAIATGSSAVNNDIVANTFHLVASPIARTISGFGAPIGGYCLDCGAGGGPGMSPNPTAEPLWLRLRAAGKKVVTATWPGGDGVNVVVPGAANNAIVQPAAERTVDYTVPFGASAAPFQTAYNLDASKFGTASGSVVTQLEAAGKTFFGTVLQTLVPLETATVGGVTYRFAAAALDTTDDATVNYDTLVFFDTTLGIQPGPFSRPSTGPAYVTASSHASSEFFLEGSSQKAAVAFYVARMEPDLSVVRVARYSPTFIPRNNPVLADVDDINNNVGAWGHQPDFRYPERLVAAVVTWTDAELEALYADQVNQWSEYQTQVALRAISRNPSADLVMLYFEQPDGSEHQYLLTDPRQPTTISDNTTIGAGQDLAKVSRYAGYVAQAYQKANDGVQRIIEAVGTDANGVPNSNVIVVSDHGFEAFHTAVDFTTLLTSKGVDTSKLRITTSGPAVNIYVNLAGREQGGTVTPSQYVQLVSQIRAILHGYVDTNKTYTLGAPFTKVFDKIFTRPFPKLMNDPAMGKLKSANIAQDSGDVFAMLTPGYNFDGTQSPVVRRLGDPTTGTVVLSVPNFYGAHGYDAALPNMSAILYAAGPDIGQGLVPVSRNIDIAPTILKLLGVAGAPTIEGKALSIGRP